MTGTQVRVKDKETENALPRVPAIRKLNAFLGTSLSAFEEFLQILDADAHAGHGALERSNLDNASLDGIGELVLTHNETSQGNSIACNHDQRNN